LSRHYARFDVVFMDLDELHRLNAELGYAEVDRRIRAALVYRREDIMTARWYSGDEIVAIVPKAMALALPISCWTGCGKTDCRQRLARCPPLPG